MNFAPVAKKWLNVQELHGYIGLAISTIYTYSSKNLIPHYKAGHLLRFKIDEIDDWIESGGASTKENELEELELLEEALSPEE